MTDAKKGLSGLKIAGIVLGGLMVLSAIGSVLDPKTAQQRETERARAGADETAQETMAADAVLEEIAVAVVPCGNSWEALTAALGTPLGSQESYALTSAVVRVCDAGWQSLREIGHRDGAPADVIEQCQILLNERQRAGEQLGLIADGDARPSVAAEARALLLSAEQSSARCTTLLRGGFAEVWG